MPRQRLKFRHLWAPSIKPAFHTHPLGCWDTQLTPAETADRVLCGQWVVSWADEATLRLLGEWEWESERELLLPYSHTALWHYSTASAQLAGITVCLLTASRARRFEDAVTRLCGSRIQSLESGSPCNPNPKCDNPDSWKGKDTPECINALNTNPKEDTNSFNYNFKKIGKTLCLIITCINTGSKYTEWQNNNFGCD